MSGRYETLFQKWPAQEQRCFSLDQRYAIGGACWVLVRHIEDDGVLWIMYQTELQVMEIINLALKTCVSDGMSNLHRNQVVAAMDNNNTWYRAYVLETEPEISVRFIDYGSTNVVPQHHIAALPAVLSILQPLAMKVKLSSDSSCKPTAGSFLLVSQVCTDGEDILITATCPEFSAIIPKPIAENNEELVGSEAEDYSSKKNVSSPDKALTSSLTPEANKHREVPTNFDSSAGISKKDNMEAFCPEPVSSSSSKIGDVEELTENVDLLTGYPLTVDQTESGNINLLATTTDDKSNAVPVVEDIDSDTVVSVHPADQSENQEVVLLHASFETMVIVETGSDSDLAPASYSKDFNLLENQNVDALSTSPVKTAIDETKREYDSASTVCSAELNLTDNQNVDALSPSISYETVIENKRECDTTATAPVSCSVDLLANRNVDELSTSSPDETAVVETERESYSVSALCLEDVNVSEYQKADDLSISCGNETVVDFLPAPHEGHLSIPNEQCENETSERKECHDYTYTVEKHEENSEEGQNLHLPLSNTDTQEEILSLQMIQSENSSVLSDKQVSELSCSSAMEVVNNNEDAGLVCSEKTGEATSAVESLTHVSEMPRETCDQSVCEVVSDLGVRRLHSEISQPKFEPETDKCMLNLGTDKMMHTTLCDNINDCSDVQTTEESLKLDDEVPDSKASAELDGCTSAPMTCEEVVNQIEDALKASLEGPAKGSVSTYSNGMDEKNYGINDHPAQNSLEYQLSSIHYEISLLREENRQLSYMIQALLSQDFVKHIMASRNELVNLLSSIRKELKGMSKSSKPSGLENGTYSEKSKSKISPGNEPVDAVMGFNTAVKDESQDFNKGGSQQDNFNRPSAESSGAQRMERRGNYHRNRPSKVICLKNFDIKEVDLLDKLYNLCGVYGHVMRMRISKDFVLVEMAEAIQAEAVLQNLNGAPFMGRKLDIHYCSFDTVRLRRDEPRNHFKDFSKSHQRHSPQFKNTKELNPPSHRLRILKVPQSVNNNDVKAKFASNNFHIQGITNGVSEDREKKNIIVSMFSLDDAINALSLMHGQELVGGLKMSIDFVPARHNHPSNSSY